MIPEKRDLITRYSGLRERYDAKKENVVEVQRVLVDKYDFVVF
jgi:hypothetical protein